MTFVHHGVNEVWRRHCCSSHRLQKSPVTYRHTTTFRGQCLHCQILVGISRKMCRGIDLHYQYSNPVRSSVSKSFLIRRIGVHIMCTRFTTVHLNLGFLTVNLWWTWLSHYSSKTWSSLIQRNHVGAFRWCSYTTYITHNESLDEKQPQTKINKLRTLQSLKVFFKKKAYTNQIQQTKKFQNRAEGCLSGFMAVFELPVSDRFLL